MAQKIILEKELFNITLHRLCHELIENYQNFEDTVIIGMQSKGVFLARRIRQTLLEITGIEVPLGYLDVTFYRDDFRRRDAPLKANETRIDFVIEDQRVILIDDVLYTGRSVRAALDAMTAFGRPQQVALLVLINRLYSRNLPIEPNYIGLHVNTMESQRVKVELKEQSFEEDRIYLISTSS